MLLLTLCLLCMLQVLIVKQVTSLTMKGGYPHDTSYARAGAKDVRPRRPSRAVYFMSGAPS